MANMDIAEKRLPQDGRIDMVVSEERIDLRISTAPVLYGETVVMRILRKDSGLLHLSELGMQSDELSLFESAISSPHGIVLVTGPTGSGKTTTLYAALNKINTSERKIITIEDPVEYQLDGINQMQVNTKAGFTFGNGLRSILRQDPDIIMVGEIRDKETAEIAIHAALTGHLVLSTLHTNDAPSAIARLLDMGIEPFLISSTLRAVLAQRLIRVLCPHCKERYASEDGTSEWRTVGCLRCRNIGYLGRTGIYELLLIFPDVERLILEKNSAVEIRAGANMRGLLEDGKLKVASGITSIGEVMRVTQQ